MGASLVTQSEDDASGLAAKTLAIAGNLPEPLAAGGLKAISRLIGGVADYPSAWLRRAAQGVEDGTNARTLVSNALATAAAQKAASDPKLVERALGTFLSKETRKQANREKVAQQTAEALAEPHSGTVDQKTAEAEPIDDDWMNVFERYAEDASSERMQILWGRLLAGEIRKPRTFSLSTMRLLAEADQELVQMAKRVSEYIVGGKLIFRDLENDSGPAFRDLLAAQEVGLISGVQAVGGLVWQVQVSPTEAGHIVGNTHVMKIEASAEWTAKFDVYSVTRVGREIASLNPSSREAALLTLAAKKIGTPPVTAIHVGRRISDDKMEYPAPVWTAPQDDPV